MTSATDKEHMKLVVEAQQILLEIERGTLREFPESLALFYAACIYAGAMGNDERELIRCLMRITDDSRAVLPVSEDTGP